MGKILICRCEDILKSEIETAIEAGHSDIESLKRYTGFGTGACQGKSCVSGVARVLCEHSGIDPSRIKPFTPRPPLAPLPLRLLAAEEDPDEGESE